MALKVKSKLYGVSGARRSVLVLGSFTLTAAGAIASATGFCPSAAAAVTPGVVKTATETGRYTLSVDRKVKKIRLLGAPALVGPTDAAFGNTDANAAQYRNVGQTSFDIQLFLASSGADTDGASGTIIHWSAYLELD